MEINKSFKIKQISYSRGCCWDSVYYLREMARMG